MKAVNKEELLHLYSERQGALSRENLAKWGQNLSLGISLLTGLIAINTPNVYELIDKIQENHMWPLAYVGSAAISLFFGSLSLYQQRAYGINRNIRKALDDKITERAKVFESLNKKLDDEDIVKNGLGRTGINELSASIVWGNYFLGLVKRTKRERREKEKGEREIGDSSDDYVGPEDEYNN